MEKVLSEDLRTATAVGGKLLRFGSGGKRKKYRNGAVKSC